MQRLLLACVLWAHTVLAAVVCQSAPASRGDAPRASAPAVVRDNLLGECRLPDGKPWSGAQITLWSSVMPERWDFGAVDQVDAVSDGEGRFKAPLLPVRRYVALARSPAGQDAVWFSAVTPEVRVGDRLILTRASQPERPTQVRLSGLEAWRAAGVAPEDLRVSASLGAAPPWVLKANQDGLVTVPARPAGAGPVAVTLPGGRPLAVRSLRQYAPGETRPEVLPFVVNPPVHVRVVVRVQGDKSDDAKAKAQRPPIPGARVWLGPEWARDGWHPVGTTDAVGQCDVWIEGAAPGQEPGGLMQACQLQVDAPGHAILRRPLAASAGDEWDAAAGLRSVTCFAPPGYSAQGRLVGVDSKPLAGVKLLLSIAGNEDEDDHSHNGFEVDYRPVVTGADGRFVLPALDRNCTFQVLVDACQPGLFPPAGSLPIQPLAVLAQGQFKDQPVLDLGDLGAGTLGVTAVDVRAPDGAPVGNPRALLVAPDAVVWGPPDLPEIRGDRRGRVVFRVPAGKYSLLVWERGLVRTEPIEVKGGAAAAPAKVVTLEPALSLRGRVVDKEGKPVPGAQVYVRQSSSRGGNGLDPLERRAHQRFNGQGLHGTADTTGSVQCWFLPIPGTTYGVVAHGLVGGTVVSSGVVTVGSESVAGAEFVLPAVLPEPEAKPGAEQGAGK